MSVPFRDLRREVDEVRDEVVDAITGVLDGGRFVLGDAVDRFERAFAEWCGAEHCVGVGSGTDAIALALRAVGVGAGDEVITAANSCVPTVAGIEAAGATPVLADADPATYTLAPSAIEEALTPRTRAIVPVHLYGRCADMAAIVAVARARGLRVVEDAAQAHGAEHAGRRAGALGDAAAFSFYPTKNLGAFGDAGAVVTGDEDVAERVRRLRSYGEAARYESLERGFNSRLDELQAAVLLAKLPRLDGWNARRRAIAARYAEALAGGAVSAPADDPGHVYHLYVVRSSSRDEFRSKFAAAGIETAVHYPRAIHEHEAYRSLARVLPESEQLAREVVSLPLHPQLADSEVEAVAEVLSAV